MEMQGVRYFFMAGLADTDGDTLNDNIESNSGTFVLADPLEDSGTNPTLADTDGDGLDDGEERPETTGTSPLDADSDDDYLSDGDEVNMHGTNPLSAYSDTDAFTDNTEIIYKSDPLDPNSVPENILDILFVGGAVAATQAADDEILDFISRRYGVEAITYIQASVSTVADTDGRT
jgi:hypothetical protein